ncbi:ComEC/Rec2 family competence protein [Nocardia vaccinii]|uniref:ComEC/Rec2 family competence protein n=1 Tax=Nocardia vaccinii TaxID=1822 RepID=UPI00082B093A|nr:ComEC/Rec2 family competence protein [Nocardia vaccinii]
MGERADGDAVLLPQVLDARLVPAAVLCWGTTIVTVLAGWRTGLLVVGVLVGVAIVAGVCAVRAHGDGLRMAAAVLLAAVVAGAGFGTAAAWREYRVATHPLRTAAVGTSLTVTVVPTDDPKPLPARSFGGRQWMVEADLREYRYGRAPVRAGGSVIVLAARTGWPGLLPGQAVRFRARLDRPWRRDLTVAVLRAQGPPVTVERPPWWQRAAGSVRAHFAAAASRALPSTEAGLLPGLVDGDVSRLPDHVREDFQHTELSHLVAVSGTNVTIVLAAVLISVRLLTIDPRVGAVLAALALVGFVVLARPSPTVLRAAVMGAVALLAVLLGRRKQALPALCGATIGLIGWSPQLALDIGFALSVLATVGLIVLAPRWSHWLEERGWRRGPAEAVGVATAAFLLTVPLIVALTGHVGLLAIVANLLVEPVIAPITVVGAIGAVLSCTWLPAGVLVLRLTGPPLWWLLFVAERGASLGISVSLPDGPRGGFATAILVAGLLVLLHRVTRPADPSCLGPPEGESRGAGQLGDTRRETAVITGRVRQCDRPHDLVGHPGRRGNRLRR